MLYQLNIPDNAFIVLSVGELNKNKNHEVIIRSIAELEDSQVHYIICGDGCFKDKLIKLSKKLGISNNIHLIGHRSDIPELSKISDVFAFPSRREGLGMAALEAMARGLPLITSNIHGIKDYSKNTVNGFTYSPNDVLGFSRGIRYFKNHKDKANEIGTKNMSEVKRFGINETLKTLKSIYD